VNARRLLVLGGTRSGKSRYALDWARAVGIDDVTFVATARLGDPELEDRIAAHRAYRPGSWRTIEAGLDLPAALVGAPGRGRPGGGRRGASRQPVGVAPIDCLTLWVSALVEAERPIAPAWAALEASLDTIQARVVAVSDEVGHGVVPAFELGRRFRDDQGWLNQRVAAAFDEVVLMLAGLPLALKGGDTRRAPAP
jgi:adenosylcobinamide kinase/adenosylcobinamide-phosphate guanylyltransferase